MSLEEAILDRVRRLPPAKQEVLLRIADELSGPEVVRMVPFRDRSLEIQWLNANRSRFADHWVALEGDRLISADADAFKVFDAARAEGIQTPFVVHIQAEDSLPFVPGW